MNNTKRLSTFFPLLVTFFLWGSIYVGGKLISDQVPAVLVASLRCFVAIFPLMAMARKHFAVKIAKEDWRYFFLVGIFGYFISIILIQMAISRTGASMAALINSTTPVGVTLLAAVILKERITPVKILCLVLAVAGACIISSGANQEGELVGILLMVLAVISWSIASVLMRKLTAKYPPILVTTYSMAISLVFYLPAGILSVVQAGGTGLTLKSGLVILYLGLFGSGLAQYTWTASLAKLPASICSLFYPLQPAFSALLGTFILHESFPPTFFVGMLLIAVDVLLSGWEASTTAAPSNVPVDVSSI